MSSFDTADRENVWSDKGFLRYGLWRAKVLDNVDTQGRGRLQVRILHLHPEPLAGAGVLISSSGSTERPDSGATGPGKNRATGQGIEDSLCPWAEPALPFGGNTGEDAGFFMLPAVNSTVWVAFEMGFSGNPIWLGSWLGSGEVPSEATANPQYIRVIKTPTGHKIVFDDKPGQKSVTIQSAGGYKVKLDDTAGNVSVTLGSNTIVLTAAGVLTVTTAGAVNINAAGNVTLGDGAVKGVCVSSLLTVLNTFIGVFNAHTHVYSPGPGVPVPTAVPVAPGTLGVAGVDTSTTVLARAL